MIGTGTDVAIESSDTPSISGDIDGVSGAATGVSGASVVATSLRRRRFR